MENILCILKEIKETQGTNAKINILKSYLEKLQYTNELEYNLLLDVLYLLYNPTISTHIAKKKIDKKVIIRGFKVLQTPKDFICFLKHDCTGKDIDIATIQHYISTFKEDLQIILKEIVCQTLTIGMDYKNINKSIGYDYIKVIQPMLAYNYDNITEKELNDDFYVTIKLDGVRFIVIVDNQGNKIALSRNGFILEGFDNFLNQLELKNGYLYDGELLPSDLTITDSKEQYRQIMKITRTKGDKKANSMIYNIFDMVDLNEYNSGKLTKIYSDRRKDLATLNNNPYQHIVTIISKLNLSDDEDKKELMRLLKYYTSMGAEGLMINKGSMVYEPKRSRAIYKIKQFKDCDILCTGIEEGDGRFKGTLGAIICDYKGYKLKVGSGFNDEQRMYFFNNPQEIVGKIVKIQYFEQTQNQDGGISLRFPIFLEVRTDKKEVSYE